MIFIEDTLQDKELLLVKDWGTDLIHSECSHTNPD